LVKLEITVVGHSPVKKWFSLNDSFFMSKLLVTLRNIANYPSITGHFVYLDLSKQTPVRLRLACRGLNKAGSGNYILPTEGLKGEMVTVTVI
jgi:hypothetical protein